MSAIKFIPTIVMLTNQTNRFKLEGLDNRLAAHSGFCLSMTHQWSKDEQRIKNHLFHNAHQMIEVD